MQGIAHWIAGRATICPRQTALVGEARRLTYEELAGEVGRMAATLRQRGALGLGDRVAILAGNDIEYLELLFAVAALGAIAVPLNIRLHEEELAYQLADSSATLLIADAEHRDQAERQARRALSCRFLGFDEVTGAAPTAPASLTETDAALPCLICYTSGTSGQPKGAVLTQANLFWNAVNNTLALELTTHDRALTLLPLFHIGGIGCFALPVLFAGGTVFVPRRFEPRQALALIAAERITIMMGVPTMHDALLHEPAFSRADLSSVRWWYSGGAPCPPALSQAMLARGLPFAQGYGLTEAAPTVLMPTPADERGCSDSVGKPVLFTSARVAGPDGVEARPGEVGELLVRGPNVFQGYWNRPEATAAAFTGGWFRTGDLARTDAAGRYFVVGRWTDLIISGGENIYPLEVEQVIAQHPAVAEVAVVGMPDARWGEVPVAVVVPRAGPAPTEAVLVAYCRDRLAKYKCPTRITFRTALPKTATGKVARAALAPDRSAGA